MPSAIKHFLQVFEYSGTFENKINNNKQRLFWYQVNNFRAPKLL
jgi:hypothetical protein